MATDPRMNVWDTASNREAESDGAGNLEVTPELASTGQVDWMATARHCANTAQTFMNANLRFRWTRNYRAYQSRHNDGSKYSSKRYRGRSSLFRPKTRMAVRKADAAVGAAYFATHDVVQMSAENDADELQLAGAKLQHELLNLRLDRANTDFGIPWFHIVIGAHQDAKITGICCSKQSWKYEEDVLEYVDEEFTDPETGENYIEQTPVTKVRVSRPEVDLIEPENCLRDPAAHWIDQAQNSSFIILRYPMTKGDVRARMGAENPIGQAWKVYGDWAFSKTQTSTDDSAVRRARESKGIDRMDDNYTTVSEHDTVWVHENFIRMDGMDMHFWSLGTDHMLTDPAPVREVYPEQGGRRPIVIGYGQIESHKVDPQSMVESWQPLQTEANDIVNLRLDNIKQNMSPITKVRRGRNVDVSQLQNRSADSVVWMQSLDDIEWDRPPDVSGSAYAEMDRINADLDDLAGTFSTSSVQTQRQMNETVGGMNLMSASSNTLAEHDIRVLNETWMEPCLRQLANLNAYYEHDERILTVAGAKAGIWDQYVDGMTDLDGLLSANVQIRVDASMGASDPMQRLQKMRMGAETIAVILGPEQAAMMANSETVIEEVFGILGYKDGKRFYNVEGPSPQEQQMQQQMQMAMQEIERLQKELEDGTADRENKIMIEQIKAAVALVKEAMETERQKYSNTVAQTAQVLGHDAQTRATNQRAQQAQLTAQNQQEANKQKAEQAKNRAPALV